MEKQVVYTFPGTERTDPETGKGIPGSADTVTLTIGTASALDYARYEALRWETSKWFRDKAGFNSWETPAELTPEQEAAVRVMDVGVHRAYMLPCVKRIEWSGEPVMDLVGLSIEAFANDLPAGLYNKWKRAALECNPQIFWPDASSEGKG
jgi:hypothetical protein